MSKFFNTRPGYSRTRRINLDHVVCVDQHWCKATRETTTVFMLADGTTHETTAPFNPEEHSCHFVPAAAGTAVFTICINTDDDTGRPTECLATLEPVIAWAIPPGNLDNIYPTPVFLQPPAGNEEIVYPLPEGKCRILEYGDFDSLADAVEDMLTRAQAQWDRTRAPQGKPANAPV